MKINGTVLVAIGILASAGPSLAGPSVSLAPGGRTLAGPGRNTIAIGATETVYTHAVADSDVCMTVVNGSRSSTVGITMVDESAVETVRDVAPQGLAALCADNVARIDLSCVGTATCATQWRVDSK